MFRKKKLPEDITVKQDDKIDLSDYHTKKEFIDYPHKVNKLLKYVQN